MTKSTLAKAAGAIALLTIVSNLLGFVRETSLAAIFGATFATDAYLMAQTIPYLLFATISYALTTTFIPIYSHLREEEGPEAGFRFAGTVIWAVLGLALVFVVAGELLAEPLVHLVAPGFDGPVAELTVYLSRIIFPMMIFQLLSGILTGLLQTDGRFGVPAAAGLFQNVAVIVAIIGFGPRYGIMAVAVGTLVGSFLSFVAKIPAALQLGLPWRATFEFDNSGLRQMAALMLPAIIGAGAGQLNTLIDRVLASGLPEGRVAALSYADRLMTLAPTIIGASIVTVVYPTLARLAARRDWRGLSSGLADTLGLIYFALAPVAAGVLVLREPLVRVVFERGVFDAAATDQTARALLFLSLGVGVFTMRNLVSRAFFALRDTRTPMFVGMITVGTNIGLNLLLVGPLEQGGLALGTTLASLIGLVLALWAFRRKSPIGFPGRRLLGSLLRTASASAVMGGIIWFVYPHIENILHKPGVVIELMRIASTAALGAGIYLGLAWLLRVPELLVAFNFLRRGYVAFSRRMAGVMNER